ncbi:MAG: hypothetical protein JJE53_00360 [Candidatus Pacebacteria bacterium]|nr:hypothetical protein [Candidatus Paceibacterota bacterium]
MKKNLILTLGFIVFINSGICFLFLVHPIEKESPILFYLLLAIVIASAMMTGQYFYRERGVYHWRWLKEEKKFEILAISADFESYNNSKAEADVVVNIEGFGKAIVTFPTSPTYWLNHTPKKGEKFFLLDENFYLVQKIYFP